MSYGRAEKSAASDGSEPKRIGRTEQLDDLMTVLHSEKESFEAFVLGMRSEERRENPDRQGCVLCFISVAESGGVR